MDQSEGAKDILQEYWNKIGGKPKDEPEPSSVKKGRGKRKAVDTPASASPALAKKGRKGKAEPAANGNKRDLPPPDTWEVTVDSIVTIEELAETDDGQPKSYMVYLAFNDGRKSSFNMRTVRQNCPQKVRYLVTSDRSSDARTDESL